MSYKLHEKNAIERSDQKELRSGAEVCVLELSSSLIELAEYYSASLRLRNGLKKAIQSRRLPFHSIEAYLSYESDPVVRITRMRSLGHGSAEELDRLIQMFKEKLNNSDKVPSSSQNEDLLDTLIVDILDNDNSSFKLFNLFQKHTKEVLPFSTLREYLSCGRNAHEKILQFKSVGRKTANELSKIVQRYVEDNNLDAEQILLCSTSKEEFSTEKTIDEEILDTLLVDLIRTIPCSVRLSNCIINNYESDSFPYKTVGDYLQFGSNAKDLILKFGNTGRKSARELDELILNYIKKQKDPEESEEKALKYPSELILYLLEELSPREADVLSRRYGLSGITRQTLEEIGLDLGVTRERVRQLEKKTLKKLSLRVYKNVIEKVLEKNEDNVYRVISDNNGIVIQDGLKKKLPGQYLLLIDLLYEGLEVWLSKVAICVGRSWYRGPFSKEEIEACIKKIKQKTKEVSLPALTRSLKNCLDEDEGLIDVCLSLDANLDVYKNIVFEKPIGRRKRRQARLYELLYGNIHPLMSLVEAYNSYYQEERCSYRDAYIVMCDAPQLFIALGDEDWGAVGYFEQNDLLHSNRLVNRHRAFEEQESEESSDECTSNSSAGFVRQLLRDTGPIHFVELRDEFVRRSSGKYSPSSLGPIMHCNDGFVRLAPGVYGLVNHLGEIEPKFLNTDVLMQSSDCYLYVLSRWAGEPVDSFPLWSYDLEYRWCKWAKQNANDGLFSSLLAISSPSRWTVDDEERTHWLSLKGKRGFYCLDVEARHSLYDKLPSLRELYAILLSVEKEPSLSWIRINKKLGKRLTDNHSASFLAVLIALRVIRPTETWQHPHNVDAHGTYLREELGKALAVQGSLPWSSPLGMQLILKMKNALTRDLGWVDVSEFEYLISELSEEKQSVISMNEDEVYEDGVQEEESLDSLLKKHQRKQNNYDLVIESLLSES